MHQRLHRARSCLIGGFLALVLATSSQAGKDPDASAQGQRTHLTNVTFVAFDTETTGFDPISDRVVEIGAVKFRGGEIIEKQSWLVNPGREIPYWARRVHGITDEMVSDEPGFKDVYPEFARFIKGAVLLAHNARFDVAFLNAETTRNQVAAPSNDVIDTLALFRKWFPESEKFSLEGLTAHLTLPDDTLHRALADSHHILLILEAGLETRPGLKTLGSLEKDAGGTLQF